MFRVPRGVAHCIPIPCTRANHAPGNYGFALVTVVTGKYMTCTMDTIKPYCGTYVLGDKYLLV